jgi:hypothetical protein
MIELARTADLVVKLETTHKISGCYTNSCAKRHVFKRAPRKKCSAPKYGGPQRRSPSTVPGQSVNNATLWRRMMTLPDSPGQVGGVEGFIMRETKRNDAEAVVWPIMIGNPKTAEDVNTALFHDFSQVRSLVATHLQGCTMLVVISHLGVYIGHYWENISFAPDDDFRHEIDGRKETDEEVFKRTVLDGLENGVPGVTASQKELQMSFTEFAHKYGDENVRAYLIRPRTSKVQEDLIDNGQTIDPASQGYPERWKSMKDIINKILPKTGDADRWTEVIYDAIDDEDQLEDEPRGRLLFKFDPDHLDAGRRQKKSRLAVLWSEQREVHREEWKET